MGDEEIQSAQSTEGQKRFSLKRLILVIIVVLVIAIAIVGGYLWWFHATTAFTIDGQRYTKSSYNELIADAAKSKISAQTAKNTIVNISKDQYVAKKLNIDIQSSNVSAAARTQFLLSTNDSINSYQSLVGWDNAFQSYLSEAKTGGYQGAVFFFPFNMLSFISIPNYPKPAGWGNPADIAAAQQYAMDEANSYYAKLKAGTITPAQVVSQVQANSKLQFAGTSNDSTQFFINPSGYTQTSAQSTSSPVTPDILAEIKSFNKTGLTPIETESDSYPSWTTYDGQTTPLAIDYYFVDIQQIVQPNANIQQTVSKDLSGLTVKIDV